MKRIHVLVIILAVMLGIFFLLTRETEWDEIVRPAAPRKNWLVEKYGQKLYSQYNEELVIRDYFQGRENGFFVDVGASDYKVNSTTYYLEKHLGWRGVAVDAQCEYAKDYMRFRKNTQFYCFFVSDKSDREVDFFINIKNKRVSTGDLDFAWKQGEFVEVKTPTITLDALLDKIGIAHFDFLSMDIELGEPAALAGFDINRFNPSLVCIEAHREVRQQILDYFEAHHYRRLDDYDSVDRLNYYFAAPADEEEKWAESGNPNPGSMQ